jgi:hypothetical protein
LRRLPPTTHKQRSRYYDDIEALIVYGFLTHPVQVGEASFELRSLLPGDLLLLNARMRVPHTDWRSWMVATSAWLINGYCMLGSTNAIPQIMDQISQLPPRVLEVMFSLVVGLYKRASRAIAAVESFCYEAHSRYLWRAFGGTSGGWNINIHAGLPETAHLGTNNVQRMWIAHNVYEDLLDKADQEWEGFKLVASSMSPKGVEKLNRHDRSRKNEEEQRRQAVQDKFYYEQRGIRVGQDGVVEDQGIRFPRKSVDDLSNEMQRWVAGDMDEHDRIVEAYKAQVLARHDVEIQAREESRQKMLQQLAEQEQDQSIQSAPLVGYTASEVVQIIQQRSVGVGIIPGTRRIYEEDPRDVLVAKLKRKESRGLIRSSAQGLVAPEAHLAEDGDTFTLDERVAARDVQIRGRE